MLVAALVGLCVYYGATWAANWPYPTTEDLVTDAGSYVGGAVLVTGPVSAVDAVNGTMTVVPSGSYPSFEMTVTGVERAVEPGGTVHVFGTLRPDGTVSADRVLVVNATFAAELYKYGVSVVGAALVLVVFFRRWRLDREALAFEVRADG